MMKMSRILSALFCGIALPHATAATVTFGTAADYDSNFVEYTLAPALGWTASGGGRLEKNGGNSATTLLYNTTATGGTGGSGGTGVGTVNNNTFNNFVVQMDFASEAFSTGGNSLGFFTKVNSAGAGYATLFRLTTTGAADFRIYDSASSVILGSLEGGATPLSTQNFTVGANSFVTGTMYTFKLAVEDISGGVRFSGGIYNATNGIQIGNTLTYTDSSLPAFGAGQIGLRLGTNGTPSNFYDNFIITPIPEPSAAVLAGLGAMAASFRRRRAQ